MLCLFLILPRIKSFWRQLFVILSIHTPSLGSCEVSHKIWARSVQPFWRLLDTNRQPYKQSKYIAEMKDWIAWWVFNTSEKTYLFRFIIRCEFELQGVQYFMESSSTLLFSLVSPTYTMYSLCTVHKPYKKNNSWK